MIHNADILPQLGSPDPVGVTLALFRTRAHRFSDDPRHYVLAEVLEERFIRGCLPQPETVRYLDAWLDQMRHDGTTLPFAPQLARAEAIDVESELAERHDHNSDQNPLQAPDQVVVIVGAPRSGTSHIHNLLARTELFAYFTTVSCWAWPTRSLARPERIGFEKLGDRFFAVDNRTTRLIPALVTPAEAEDIHQRAIPTYHHLRGHTYDLHPARLRDEHLLRRAVSDHLRHAERTRFLTKSPFHSLRIPILDQLWGTTARYIHITRDAHAVAESITRNRFNYLHRGQPLDGQDARRAFVDAVEAQAPPERLHVVGFDELLQSPRETIRRLMEWLSPVP